jgi:dTDP-glucose 4,6-dehydratase
MKVVVTGGAGFIGSNLVHYLAEVRPTWEITVVDLLTYAGNLENLKGILGNGNVSFEKIDITDGAAVEKLFQGAQKSGAPYDIVFHLAAESHVDRSIHGAAAFVKTNVLGTQTLLDAARASGVKRFVHVSTDEVYGSLGPTGRFLETTPLDPTSPYSASKASSDLMALASAKTHGFDVVVTRCTNNYGPFHFPEKLIPLFITNALDDKPLPLYGDGMNVRSWLYVRDHAEALLLVAEKGRTGEVYNIGGSEEAEIPNVAVTKAILKRLNKPETLIKRVADRPAHDLRYAIDYTKINRELGWSPRTPFAVGIEKTITWYLANESWWRDIKSGAYLSYYEKNYADRLAV